MQHSPGHPRCARKGKADSPARAQQSGGWAGAGHWHPAQSCSEEDGPESPGGPPQELPSPPCQRPWVEVGAMGRPRLGKTVPTACLQMIRCCGPPLLPAGQVGLALCVADTNTHSSAGMRMTNTPPCPWPPGKLRSLTNPGRTHSRISVTGSNPAPPLVRWVTPGRGHGGLSEPYSPIFRMGRAGGYSTTP